MIRTEKIFHPQILSLLAVAQEKTSNRVHGEEAMGLLVLRAFKDWANSSKDFIPNDAMFVYDGFLNYLNKTGSKLLTLPQKDLRRYIMPLAFELLQSNAHGKVDHG